MKQTTDFGTDCQNEKCHRFSKGFAQNCNECYINPEKYCKNFIKAN